MFAYLRSVTLLARALDAVMVADACAPTYLALALLVVMLPSILHHTPWVFGGYADTAYLSSEPVNHGSDRASLTDAAYYVSVLLRV